MQNDAITRAMVRDACAGKARARAAIAQRLDPVIRRGVRAGLRRVGAGADGRAVDDLVDHGVSATWEILLRADAAKLRAWDPAQARCETYVFGIAWRVASQVARASFRKTPAAVSPAAVEELEASAPSAAVLTRARRLTERLRGHLSERDWRIFVRHFRDGHTAREIAADEGMTREAVKKVFQKIRRTAVSFGEGPRRRLGGTS